VKRIEIFHFSLDAGLRPIGENKIDASSRCPTHKDGDLVFLVSIVDLM